MLTGDPSDAEDLLQASFVRSLKHADRIETMNAPAAYLRRVLVNEHTSRGRRKSRRVRTVAESADRPESASTAGPAIEHRDEAWRWLATLPPRQRAVLVLRFYEDLPDADIADVLGIGEGTVRSNASRGLAALRMHLGQKEES